MGEPWGSPTRFGWYDDDDDCFIKKTIPRTYLVKTQHIHRTEYTTQLLCTYLIYISQSQCEQNIYVAIVSDSNK